MAIDPEKLTLDDYLILEERSEIRHEYIDGELRAMTGATRRHAQLITNLCCRAKTAAANRCQVYVAGMMLRVEEGNRMYYPDVVGCCDPADNHDRYLILPCFVIEVLSRRTARIDRREKLAAYFTLPSVEQYAIVEQDCMRIEVYQRERGPWNPDVLEMPDDVLELSCIGLRVALKDVYEGVKLPPLEVRRPEVELPAYAEDEC
jgi:Uma2 family endonuclease